MKKQELEYKVLGILDRLKQKQPIEDSHVELKAQWISPHEKAARRIAGHANAARGEPILWVIGADEDQGVVGADDHELARWLPAVKSQFEGLLAPELLINLAIPTRDQSVVALYFETDRAPYLVKNPNFGTPDGGPVAFEVPWREGNATRTARRPDLLKLLMPIQRVPIVEVLEAKVECVSRPQEKTLTWSIAVELYLVPHGDRTVYLPHHRCDGWFDDLYSKQKVAFGSFALQPGTTEEITRDNSQLCVRGPGKVRATGQAQTPFRTSGYPETLTVGIRCGVVDTEGHSIQVDLALERLVGQNNPLTWLLGK
jgi:hypothetical protein